MRYVKPNDLDSSYIGKWVHLDFGQRSFATFDYDHKRPLDTVTIELNGKKVTFIEHRVDDGFNNWFEDQYLEAVKTVDGMRIRIIKHKLLAIEGDLIRVESYLDVFDKKGRVLKGKSFTKEFTFQKDEIFELLVKFEKGK